METKDNIITAEQAFLLCLIREEHIVVAKNMQEYPWTFRHHCYVQNKKLELLKLNSCLNNVDKEIKEEEFKQEAKKKFPAFKPESRSFGIHGNDYSFDLSDLQEDLAWYCPSIYGGMDRSQWAYQGTFLLAVPLTRKEKFVLESYSCVRH